MSTVGDKAKVSVLGRTEHAPQKLQEVRPSERWIHPRIWKPLTESKVEQGHDSEQEGIVDQ